MTTATVEIGFALQKRTDFDALPAGTIIGPVNTEDVDEQWTKIETGRWIDFEGTTYTSRDFALHGHNEVKSLPVNGPVFESLIQWQFRYRDNAYQSAESAGVSRSVVDDVCAQLGVSDDMFPLGKGVSLLSNHDLERLPIGAQVARGRPQNPSRFGLFVKRADNWKLVLGEQTGFSGHRVTVVSGDPPEWVTTPGTERDVDLINEFKARAWRVGWKVKKAQRWCDTYESYMHRVGLDASALQHVSYAGITVGEKVEPTLAASLPVGSVFKWVSRNDPNTWTWYIRADDTRNVSRTKALFGHRTDGGSLRNSASTMEVVHIEDGHGMDIRVAFDDVIIPHLPVGTKVQYSAVDYIVCQDHRVTGWTTDGRPPERGQWDWSQLGGALSIAGFPA